MLYQPVHELLGGRNSIRQSVESQTEQLDQFLLVEPHHRLAVDDRHRRALKTLIDQFFQRRLVGADVLFNELHAPLR